MALPRRRDQGEPTSGDVDWRIQYAIKNLDEVDQYVVTHPTVAPILIEAPGEIRAVFGEGGALVLTVEHDPEDGDSWLKISIPAEAEDETVLPLIYAREDRW
jgi:hypothetical protein